MFACRRPRAGFSERTNVAPRPAPCSSLRGPIPASEFGTPVRDSELWIALARLERRGAGRGRRSCVPDRSSRQGHIVLKPTRGSWSPRFSGATAGNGINFGADGVVLEGFRDHPCPEEGVPVVHEQHRVRKNHVHDCGLVLVNGNTKTAYRLRHQRPDRAGTTSTTPAPQTSTSTVTESRSKQRDLPHHRSLDRGLRHPGGDHRGQLPNITIAHNVISRASTVLSSCSTRQRHHQQVVIVNNVLMANANNPSTSTTMPGWRRRSARSRSRTTSSPERRHWCTSPQRELFDPAQHVHGEREPTFTSTTLLGFRDLAARDYYPEWSVC